MELRHQAGQLSRCEWSEAGATRKDATPVWREGGVYLISGGAGALARLLTAEIARRVTPATVILAARSSSREDADGGSGLRVRHLPMDVTRPDEVDDLIKTVLREHGRLDGVIHAAGLRRDNYVINKPVAELQSVLGPKVAGLVNLDHATRELPLDFFVTFSSLAAFGNAGQADYAAANGFMDGFMELRSALVSAGKRQGRTVSIRWPLWAGGGMQLDSRSLDVLMQRTGMAALGDEAGLDAFYRALELAVPGVAVWTGEAQKLRELASGVSAVPPPPQVAPSPTGVSESITEKVEAKLKALFSEVTRYEAHRIDARQPMERYGIDSIVITQMNQALDGPFRSLSKTLFFEYRTLSEVSAYLAEHRAEESAIWVAAQQGVVSFVPQGAVASRVDAPASVPRADEPIAIIGMSGRYPKAGTLTEFWERLSHGEDCITEIPSERWSLDGFFYPDKKHAAARGMSYSKWGGFLDGFADFDPLFFNISPREATNMDPQERLFLQSCWEVLEDAGYTRDSLARRFGSAVGVFAGITKTGYELYGADLEGRDAASRPYTSFASVANRVSYLLDLKGPSMPVDTMCSASLTAVHMACEALHRGACAMAIAGGVNLYVHPSSYVGLCGQQMLSTDGRCRSFGAGGNGFVPGEGVGAVLLKPLSKALADGDNIHAVIRSTSVNHGGKTNGYTVPDPQAQAALIRSALDKAGVSARDVSYLEAHGTGTELGDPIEVAGLTQAFRRDTDARAFCRLGSLKSNIGHLEAAAGIAGLTKVVLQLRHQKLAPSLHAEALNANISFAETPFVVQRTLDAWDRPQVEVNGVRLERPRLAGVSSFGAGGANAHVLVEEFDMGRQVTPGTSGAGTGGRVLFPLSAKTLERLRDACRRLVGVLAPERHVAFDQLRAMAYTLQVGREAMNARLAFTASSADDAREKLEAFLRGDAGADVLRGDVDDEACAFGRARSASTAFASPLNERECREFLSAWVQGRDVNWDGLYSGEAPPPRRVSLPTYPFERRTYWPVLKGQGGRAAPPPSSEATVAWRDAPLSDTLPWRERLSAKAGDELWVLYDDEADARRFVALLEQVRASAGVSSGVQVHQRRFEPGASGAAPLLHLGGTARPTVFWLLPKTVQDTASWLRAVLPDFERRVTRAHGMGASVYCLGGSTAAVLDRDGAHCWRHLSRWLAPRNCGAACSSRMMRSRSRACSASCVSGLATRASQRRA
ncbi:SDR family oxidoreductase [Myxococcus sp. 1LA]